MWLIITPATKDNSFFEALFSGRILRSTTTTTKSATWRYRLLNSFRRGGKFMLAARSGIAFRSLSGKTLAIPADRSAKRSRFSAGKRSAPGREFPVSPPPISLVGTPPPGVFHRRESRKLSREGLFMDGQTLRLNLWYRCSFEESHCHSYTFFCKNAYFSAQPGCSYFISDFSLGCSYWRL